MWYIVKKAVLFFLRKPKCQKSGVRLDILLLIMLMFDNNE